MKRIAVLTSGGDSPGMNAAIRAVVRKGIHSGMDVYGVRQGYEGLIDNEIFKLEWSDLGNVLHTGGTILSTARSERFYEDKWIDVAANNLISHEIEGLVVIGGDGSFRGALQLAKRGVDIVCVPATIDNDLGCTDYTIGFDTAVNTVLSIISKIRDTSSSHQRTTIIEVMGRTCGDIALFAGLGGGADEILVPEMPLNIQGTIDRVREGLAEGKIHNIIIKAEGVDIPTTELEELIEGTTGQETRSVVLSYIQRGGSPTGRDRALASIMGAKAIEVLEELSVIKDDGIELHNTEVVNSVSPDGQVENNCFAVGIHGGKALSMPLQEAIDLKPVFPKDLYELALILS